MGRSWIKRATCRETGTERATPIEDRAALYWSAAHYGGGTDPVRERSGAVDSTELRAVQQPLKDAYREHPGQAVIPLRAHGRLEDQAISCSVATSQALTVAGLHPAT